MKIGINIFPLNSAHKVRGIGYYTANLIENFKKDSSVEIVEFQNLSQLKDVDLVHYPWFDFYFQTLPLKQPFPTIVTIHDVIPLIFKKNYPTGFKGKINFFLQKVSLSKCSAYITDSETSKKDIAEYLKLKRDKIFTVPLAPDEIFGILNDTDLLHFKRKLNIPDEFLLYVGDVNWVKNLPFLIEGFNKLSHKADFADLKLVLVGGAFLKKADDIDHPELDSIKLVNKLIREYKLEEKVMRVGSLEKEELVAFYNLTTLYIQPSFYEGFGLPILEAFSCGAPVLCSNGGSLPEVGGGAAVYFDPYNLDQFISIISEILQNKSIRGKLSRLGLRQVEKFSWQKVSDETKAVYLKVLMK